MAQKTTVHLIDDIDGSEASETLSFALDGTPYEIDVNDANASQIRDALAPYVASGRRVVRGSRSATKSPSRSPQSDYDPKAVRVWAEANKVDLPARGRIPLAVLEQYRSAGN